MADPALIDKVVIDLPKARPEERADLWADAMRPLFDATLIDSDPPTHTMRGDAWLIDTLFFSSAAFGGQIVQRRPRHVAQDNTPTVLIEFYLEGSLRGELDGKPVSLDAGDVHLIDFTRSYQAQSTPSEVRGLVIPHQALGYDPAIHPPVIRVPGASPIARLVRTTILGVHQDLDSVQKQDAPRIARVLLALLRTAFLEETEINASCTDLNDARSQAVKTYIRNNLRSDQVSTNSVCNRFGISKATLYRDFKEDGGLRRFLLDSRLDAALFMLLGAQADRGAIHRTAEYWRFPNTSYFGREFKRKFGFKPSDVVGKRFSPSRLEDISIDPAPSGLAHLLKQM